MKNEVQRIDEEELDWDGDVSVLNDEPYSGEAYMNYPNGAKKREATFVNGFEEGLCQEWHQNGFKKSEWFAKRGRAEGERKYWHENGCIKSIGYYEFGVQLQFKEWDESGKLIADERLSDDDPMIEYVIQQRAKDK